jgi:hypothetical protein
MAQDANEWKRFLSGANQLFRATTHPAAVQLPLEDRAHGRVELRLPNMPLTCST